MVARGIRNKNPLNIRKSSDKFDGEVIPSQDKSFKQFETMAHGYRAAFVILGTYNKRGWNTIEKIVSHWAPPSENNTERYISFVEKQSGIERNKELSLIGSKDDYIKIVTAMSRMEIGISFIFDIIKGFDMQKKLK